MYWIEVNNMLINLAHVNSITKTNEPNPRLLFWLPQEEFPIHIDFKNVKSRDKAYFDITHRIVKFGWDYNEY